MGSRLRVWLLVSLLVPLGGCDHQNVIKFAGETQGTTYHITVVDTGRTHGAVDLQQRVERRLAEIDRALSNYRDDSELSQFNRAPVGAWIALGHDLHAILKISDQISRDSDGVFDLTVAPLVDLWGFGPKIKTQTIPDAAAIEAARTAIGFRHLELDPGQPRARKAQPLSIDVNGIAQGYTVDQVAAVLIAAGCTDFLVEIGGELRLQGLNPLRKPWRIGIERPSDGVAETQEALTGTGIGVTTAGDYHDYFEKDGVRYSHTIDPRTGRPIAHRLASVTVVAANATLADGYDTVLEVLGPEAGMAFAESRGLAAYFIVRSGDGFAISYTSQMAKFLESQASAR